MITANLLLAAGLLPLLLVDGAGRVWIVFAVMFWEGCVQQFFSPAEQAMVPRLVPEGELLTANAVNGQAANVSRLAGSAVGGVLAAAGGIVVVTLADVVSFLASAALLAMVRTSGHTATSQRGPARDRLIRVRAELGGGLRLAARNRTLRALMIFALVTSVGEGIMSTLFTPFVEHVLHGTPQDLGLIVAAQAVGGIAGGMVAAATGHRIRAARLLGLGATLFGLMDLAIFLYPLGYVAVWPAIVGMIIVGLPGALTLAGLITLFQGSSEDSYRGRVFGAPQRPGRHQHPGRHPGRGLPEPVRGHRAGAGHPGRRLCRGRPGHAGAPERCPPARRRASRTGTAGARSGTLA